MENSRVTLYEEQCMTTEKVRTITVTMELGLAEEYVDRFIITGIMAMRGVVAVHKECLDSQAVFALFNAKLELRNKLLEILKID